MSGALMLAPQQPAAVAQPGLAVRALGARLLLDLLELAREARDLLELLVVVLRAELLVAVLAVPVELLLSRTSFSAAMARTTP